MARLWTTARAVRLLPTALHYHDDVVHRSGIAAPAARKEKLWLRRRSYGSFPSRVRTTQPPGPPTHEQLEREKLKELERRIEELDRRVAG